MSRLAGRFVIKNDAEYFDIQRKRDLLPPGRPRLTPEYDQFYLMFHASLTYRNRHGNPSRLN